MGAACNSTDKSLSAVSSSLADGIHHAPLKKLYAYWLAKKGSRLAPARSDIQPAEMKPFLRHVFMLDVLGSPPRFKFRLAGTEIVNRFGEEVTGRFLDEIDLDDVTTDILLEYEKAVREAQPVYGRWRYIKRSGQYLNYERLILPLSSDGITIDMLICGAHADDGSFGHALPS